MFFERGWLKDDRLVSVSNYLFGLPTSKQAYMLNHNCYQNTLKC